MLLRSVAVASNGCEYGRDRGWDCGRDCVAKTVLLTYCAAEGKAWTVVASRRCGGGGGGVGPPLCSSVAAVIPSWLCSNESLLCFLRVISGFVMCVEQCVL